MCWLGCKSQSHWHKDDSYCQTFTRNEIILLTSYLPVLALLYSLEDTIGCSCTSEFSAFVEIAQKGFFWPSSMYSTSMTLGGAYSPWLLSTGRCCNTSGRHLRRWTVVMFCTCCMRYSWHKFRSSMAVVFTMIARAMSSAYLRSVISTLISWYLGMLLVSAEKRRGDKLQPWGSAVSKTNVLDLKLFKSTCYGLSCQKLLICKRWTCRSGRWWSRGFCVGVPVCECSESRCVVTMSKSVNTCILYTVSSPVHNWSGYNLEGSVCQPHTILPIHLHNTDIRGTGLKSFMCLACTFLWMGIIMDSFQWLGTELKSQRCQK